ncbi:BOP1NT-domain-containing protein [Ramicandelaber brevisporus]|nr:BOP1NT-domain-containing protein [Ramicandelaber brevisporus]
MTAAAATAAAAAKAKATAKAGKGKSSNGGSSSAQAKRPAVQVISKKLALNSQSAADQRSLKPAAAPVAAAATARPQKQQPVSNKRAAPGKNAAKDVEPESEDNNEGTDVGDEEFPELDFDDADDDEDDEDIDASGSDDDDDDDDDELDASDISEDFFVSEDEDDGSIGSDTLYGDDNDDEDAGSDAASRRPSTMRKADYLQWRRENKLPDIEPGYDTDSSTEDNPNTVGNVPMEWYADYPHIGYTVDGKKILKPATADEIDKFLSAADDPESWATVRDELNQKDIKLTDEELEIIRRLQGNAFPDATFDPYEPTVEWFTSKVEEMPLSSAPEPKRRFLPSKHEHQRIMKLVRGIRAGRIVMHKAPVQKPRYYDLWGSTDTNETSADAMLRSASGLQHLAAPKVALPGHGESYNPPEEYLPNEEEKRKWEEKDPSDRRGVLPRKYNNLRTVPAYNEFIQDRFQRCLDLYMAPRLKRNRAKIDPESLLPKLPDPEELRPFPTTEAVRFAGHTGMVRSISVDPRGRWLLSGSDDGTVRLWEVISGHCVFVWRFKDVETGKPEIVHSVAWSPNSQRCMFAAAVGDRVILATPPTQLIDSATATVTRSHIEAGFAQADKSVSQAHAEWQRPSHEETRKYIFCTVVPKPAAGVTHIAIKQISWHRDGNYFATIAPNSGAASVMIHQISRHATQRPFRRLGSQDMMVQRGVFHPTQSIFYLATQRTVRMYDLKQQVQVKLLHSGAKWISSIDIHPQGNNVIIGTYDRKLIWFDTDLSTRPYRSIKFHKKAIRDVAFHKRYPLFASASDDCSVQVFHGMVYQDLLQNPLIVPVKILRGHDGSGDLGVLATEWHPIQPWLFSAGADRMIRLYS